MIGIWLGDVVKDDVLVEKRDAAGGSVECRGRVGRLLYGLPDIAIRIRASVRSNRRTEKHAKAHHGGG